MKYVRYTLSALIGLTAVVPWLVLSAIGLVCLYSADLIERVKDFLQDKAIGPYGLVVAAALFAPAAFAGVELRVPLQPVPPSQYRDTETTVFVPLTNGIPSQAEFAVDVSFVPTMSNNVEVAFGEDRDRDGRLSFSETDVAFGWDCGRHFTERVQAGVRYEVDPTLDYRIDQGFILAATNLTLTYSCLLNGLGNPLSDFRIDAAYASQRESRKISIGPSSVVGASGGSGMWAETYSGVSGEAWPWRSAWNMMRVTRRGSHASDPLGSFTIRQRGGVIQMQ